MLGEVARGKVGKVVLDKASHDKVGKVMLGKVAHGKACKVMLSEATRDKTGEAVLGKVTHCKATRLHWVRQARLCSLRSMLK